MNITASIVLVLLLSPFVELRAQTFTLAEYMPYAAGSSSTLLSTQGELTLTFTGSSDTDFSWRFSGAEEDLQSNYRLNSSGLSLLTEVGLTPGGQPIATETYTPAWMIAPAIVDVEQSFESSASYAGTEPFEDPWLGSLDATLITGDVESVTTPAGNFDALRLTFTQNWQETSEEYTGNGTISQTWWVAKGQGVVKVDYVFEETVVEDEGSETEEGTFVFELKSTTLPDSPDPGTPSIVNIPDTALKQALLLEFGRSEGEITTAEMATLTNLELSQKGIRDLTGLESALNLMKLNLSRNQVVDLSPISGLTQLDDLLLGRNMISDISALEGLTELIILQLFENDGIEDISVLANMPELSNVALDNNNISDLSPLSGLTNLVTFRANFNAVEDLTPIAGITRLQEVFIWGNQINDLSPLAGLPSLVKLSAGANQIEDISVIADKQFLTILDLANNNIADLTPLAGLTGITSASLQLNFLDITPGSADREIIDTWIAGGATVTFDPQKVSGGGIMIPDTNLEAAIRSALGKPNGELTESDMLSLGELTANNLEIVDLTGLEFAKNLVMLDLGRNQIADLAPLAGLTKLTSLTLFANSINDVSPLSGLAQLDTLLLRLNAIEDVSPLSDLINLSVIWLGWNGLKDISPLRSLTRLIAVELDQNEIADLSPLSDLENLTTVTAGGNLLRDLTPLSTLTGLTVIRLQENLIEDLTPLSTLTKLRIAAVQSNFLDIALGSDDRKVMDDWLARGTEVTFEPQNERPAVSHDAILHITLVSDNVLLEWESQSGVSYQIQTSTDLITWANTGGVAIAGTGSRISQALPFLDEAQEAFRIAITQ